MRLHAFALALMVLALGSFLNMPPARAEDEAEARNQVQAALRAAPRLVIELHGDLLSMSVRDAPWGAVLKELERQTGILFRVRGTLGGTVTQEFASLPLEQGLRRLFRNANFLFFYVKGKQRGGSAEKLVRVWLFSKDGGGAEGRMLRSPAPEVAPPETWNGFGSVRETGDVNSREAEQPTADEGAREKRLGTLQVLAGQGDEEGLRQAVFDPDEIIQMAALDLLAERDQQRAVDFLISSAKSDQPDTRLQALSLLHRTRYADERTILAALSEALVDKDTSVKGYAIQALGERGGVAALGSLRRAFSDPDPSIRMMVVAGIVPEDQGLALLQEALIDDDETVRLAAAAKLAQTLTTER